MQPVSYIFRQVARLGVAPNFFFSRRERRLQMQVCEPARSGVSRRQARAAEAEVDLPVLTRIARWSGCLRMFLQQFARSSSFLYWSRPIASALWHSTDFPALVSRRSVAGPVACARSIVQQYL